ASRSLSAVESRVIALRQTVRPRHIARGHPRALRSMPAGRGRDSGEGITLEPAREGPDPCAPALENEPSSDRLTETEIAAPPADQCCAIRAHTEFLRKSGVEVAQRHLGASEQKKVTARPAHVSELDPDDEGGLGERVAADPAMNVPEEGAGVQFARLQLTRQPPLAPRTEVAHDGRELETRGGQSILGADARVLMALDHPGVGERPEAG